MNEKLQTLLKLPLYGYCRTSPIVCASNARSHTSKACPRPPEKTNSGRGKEIEREGRGEGRGQSQHKPALETSTGFLSFLLETITYQVKSGARRPTFEDESLRSNDKVNVSVLFNSAQSLFTRRLTIMGESKKLNFENAPTDSVWCCLRYFWFLFVCFPDSPLPQINNLELGINIGSSGMCKWSNAFDALHALAWRMATAHLSGWFYLLWSNMQN